MAVEGLPFMFTETMIEENMVIVVCSVNWVCVLIWGLCGCEICIQTLIGDDYLYWHICARLHAAEIVIDFPRVYQVLAIDVDTSQTDREAAVNDLLSWRIITKLRHMYWMSHVLWSIWIIISAFYVGDFDKKIVVIAHGIKASFHDKFCFCCA